jgi:uncharacterized protein YjbJ (UPF0337 family)
MKIITKDQAEVKWHQMNGKIKDVAKELSDNNKLEAEGIGEKIAGNVQEKISHILRKG